jgi:hypothetical protein
METFTTNKNDSTKNSIEKDEPLVVNTKEELIKLISEWVTLEKQMVNLKKEIKTRKIRQDKMSVLMKNLMKTNSMNDLKAPGGALIYETKVKKKAWSKKFLMEQINAFYKNNPDTASEVLKHLNDNRETTVNEKIIYKSIAK